MKDGKRLAGWVKSKAKQSVENLRWKREQRKAREATFKKAREQAELEGRIAGMRKSAYQRGFAKEMRGGGGGGVATLKGWGRTWLKNVAEGQREDPMGLFKLDFGTTTKKRRRKRQKR